MTDRSATFRAWFDRRLPYFWHNWICAAGSVLIVTVACGLALMFCIYLYNIVLSRPSNPYLDLLGFMVLPAFLGLGVVLVLVGNGLHRRRVKQGGPPPQDVILSGQEVMQRVAIVAVGTFLFMIGFGLFSFEAYHYTDSNEFCAKICHTVMEPEATAYERSPHANVHCVDCHIGPGTSWFVRAKLSGLRQVLAVATNSYARPIETPVLNLRPARDTCEVCHWPTKFHGSRLLVKEHFEPDAANTPTMTANLLMVGGPGGERGRASGIHWHVDPANEVRYRHLDRERHEIVEVVQKSPDGEIRYLSAGATDDPEAGQWRVMDCLDCHNRPTHIYEMPVPSVEEAMAAGRLDRSIPWLRKESVRVLEEVTPTDDTATAVAAFLTKVYQAEHPQDLAALQSVLVATSAELAAIIDRNIYPAMNIEWGTYGSNLSHFDGEDELGTGGCFRCHNDELDAENGLYIQQDCEKCHNLLAYRDPDWKGVEGVDAAEFLVR